jgi:hypothetical protein
MISLLLLTLMASDTTLTPAATPEALLERGEASFAVGVALRADAAKARPHFAEAARAFDELWTRGSLHPDLALARGRAHFLAGNLPAAIVALHEGLRVTPTNAELQRLLEDCRDQVTASSPAQPEESIRPTRSQGWRMRISHWDSFILAGMASGLLAIGIAKRFTTRDSWSWVWLLVGGVGLAGAGGLEFRLEQEEAQELAKPLRIVRATATLRRGNGESYPPRIESRLPRGAEVRELARRGDWVQVQLAGGAIGWLPEIDTLLVR